MFHGSKYKFHNKFMHFKIPKLKQYHFAFKLKYFSIR